MKAAFKVLKGNGNPFSCNNIDGQIKADNQCPEIDLYGRNVETGESVFRNVALAVGTMGTDWNQLYGQFTVNEEMLEADWLRLSFDRFIKSYSIIVDDISVMKMAAACPTELVVNSNLALGFESFFDTWGSGNLFNVPGSNVIGMSHRGASNHGIYLESMRWLNFDCIRPGDEFVITASVRLVDAAGLGTECDPSETKAWRDSACPAITFRLRDSDKNVVIDEKHRDYQSKWNRHEFNTLKAPVKIPEAWNGTVRNFDVAVRDVPQHLTILLAELSIQRL